MTGTHNLKNIVSDTESTNTESTNTEPINKEVASKTSKTSKLFFTESKEVSRTHIPPKVVVWIWGHSE